MVLKTKKRQRNFGFPQNLINLTLLNRGQRNCALVFKVSGINLFSFFGLTKEKRAGCIGQLIEDDSIISSFFYITRPKMRKFIWIFFLLVMAFSNAFSSPLRKQVELAIQDSASSEAAATSVYFVSGSVPNYLASEDLSMVPDTNNILQLYSFSLDNVSLRSNSYGDFSNTTIVRLGIGLSHSGTYIISAQQFTNFDPASMLFLEDRELHVFINLRHSTYTVAIAETGEITNRFFIHVTYPPVITSLPAGCTNNDGIISVTEDTSVVWTVCNVFDSTSTLIASDTNVTGNFNFTGLAGGNYRIEFDYSIYSPIQYIQVEEHQLVHAMNVSNNHDRVNQNIQFFMPGTNATRFQWDFGDGSTITGVANPTYSYLSPGIYTVAVNCSNDFGCMGHADTVMYIDVASSMDQIDGNTLTIVTDKNTVRIELGNALSADYNYDVYTVQGQLIKTGPVNQTNQVLNFINEASGIYLVSVRSASSMVSRKVLITH